MRTIQSSSVVYYPLLQELYIIIVINVSLLILRVLYCLQLLCPFVGKTPACVTMECVCRKVSNAMVLDIVQTAARLTFYVVSMVIKQH